MKSASVTGASVAQEQRCERLARASEISKQLGEQAKCTIDKNFGEQAKCTIDKNFGEQAKRTIDKKCSSSVSLCHFDGLRQ
ncbi:MAG: hypothetical protein RBU37_06265 [Myxococcota bacterium]|nr:hypothetical protein [Myxococcota bacterium]